MKKKTMVLLGLLCLGLYAAGTGSSDPETESQKVMANSSGNTIQENRKEESSDSEEAEEESTEISEPEKEKTTSRPVERAPVDLSNLPAWNGDPYVVINGNHPYFSDEDLVGSSYEHYGSLDSLGRVTLAYACIGPDLMPSEERQSISDVHPTGWNQAQYDGISGGYLYNRCHLIGFQLTGENANEQNLMTGTAYFNVEGMLPFENMVADYVKETGNHVLYRATPIFQDSNLLASGILLEGRSVEDDGYGIEFCVYCYNVQPGIGIHYSDGSSWTNAPQPEPEPEPEPDPVQTYTTEEETCTYILNTNTHKFHYPDCPSVRKMKDKNKREVTQSRESIISQGYEPCKNCNP